LDILYQNKFLNDFFHAKALTKSLRLEWTQKLANNAARINQMSGQSQFTKMSPSSGKPTVTYQRFVVSNDFGALYQELDSKSNTNKEAPLFKLAILGKCINYTGAMLRQMDEKAIKDAWSHERLAAKNKWVDRCKNLPPTVFEIHPNTLSKTALENGDPRARAQKLAFLPPTKEENTALIKEAVMLAHSRDPYVLEYLGSFFRARNSAFEWTFDDVDGPVSGSEIAAAFQLAACDFGSECGGASYESANVCVSSGICGFADRLALYKEHSLSPKESIRVDAVRQLIIVAINTGIWPNGFWLGKLKP
jgi:hypothetical protein